MNRTLYMETTKIPAQRTAGANMAEITPEQVMEKLEEILK